MSDKPFLPDEVAFELVQSIYDSRAHARGILVGVKIKVPPEGLYGEIVSLEVCPENGLLFAVKLYDAKGMLGADTLFRPAHKLCFQSQEVSPDDLTPVERASILQHRAEMEAEEAEDDGLD